MSPFTNMPTLSLRCARTTQPLATPTYTELVSLFLGGTTQRGRTSELEVFPAGDATVTLKDDLRNLDPANTSGIYTGTLKPRRRWSFRATWNAVTYDLFDGFNPNWKPVWNNKHARHGLRLFDAFELFNNATVTAILGEAPFSEQRSDQRLGWLVDECGWPAGRRTFDTGLVNIQAFAYQAANLLTAMRQVEEAEGGFLFMDAAGNLVFQNKYKRITSFGSSVATFGDAGVELRYSDPDYEPQEVANVINRVSSKLANVDDPRVFEYLNQPSIDDNGESAKTLELWAAVDTEAEARGQYLIGRYATPAIRVKSLKIKPRRDPTNLWPQALGRVIGERITVKARFYGIGSLLTHEARIEGIQHDIEPDDWTTTFSLSPVVSGIDSGSYWSLGAAGSSLGSNTVLTW